MTNLSMKKLYGLAYDWIVEQESQGLSHEEAHRRVEMIADYLDFVWRHKNQKGDVAQEPS
jgi:hypothetical protein